MLHFNSFYCIFKCTQLLKFVHACTIKAFLSGGVSSREIENVIGGAEERALENRELDERFETIVFFDEANATVEVSTIETQFNIINIGNIEGMTSTCITIHIIIWRRDSSESRIISVRNT